MTSEYIMHKVMDEAADEIATLRGQLEAAEQHIKILQEQRAALEPAADPGRIAFEKQSANWSTVTPWDELAEETRQHWRAAARTAQPPSAAPIEIPVADRATLALCDFLVSMANLCLQQGKWTEEDAKMLRQIMAKIGGPQSQESEHA